MSREKPYKGQSATFTEGTRRGHANYTICSRSKRIHNYSTSPRRFFINSGYTSTSCSRAIFGSEDFATVESVT
jgi:hypothetical protein